MIFRLTARLQVIVITQFYFLNDLINHSWTVTHFIPECAWTLRLEWTFSDSLIKAINRYNQEPMFRGDKTDWADMLNRLAYTSRRHRSGVSMLLSLNSLPLRENQSRMWMVSCILVASLALLTEPKQEELSADSEASGCLNSQAWYLKLVNKHN